ncbi:MAG: DUF4388 domain-containing protein [Acidobacteriota bacterium]
MPTQFHYRGTLAETSLAEMLWTIYRHRVPGVVEVSHDDIVKRIYVTGGDVVHATSTDRSDRLGAYLYRQELLTRQQLSETMSQRAGSDKRHGQLLIEQGLLAPDVLYEAIRGQVESIVWSLFSWTQGDLTFSIGEHEDPLMIKIHLPMRQVISRGIKKVSDTKSLVARLGRKTTVFSPSYETEDLIEIALGHDEYTLLRLVDGERTLFDICSQGPFSVSENARLLYAFRVLQLIRPKASEGTGVKVRLPAR